MIDLSSLQTDIAIYTPALSPGCAQFPFIDPARLSRPIPGGLTLQDFDLLRAEGNNLFKMSHVLYSAGHSLDHENVPCMVMNRDRSQSLVIGDSGGFQVIGGVLPPYTPAFVYRILRYLEKMADVAMTADVPTKALLNPKVSGYQNFEQCLTQTIKNLRIFKTYRENRSVKFLNVLQGRNEKEADRWYEAVREYPFEGWAFAGNTRLNFFVVCKRLVQMADRGELDSNSWLHFLAASFIDCSVVLTALKRSLRSAGFTNLEVSYDSASALISADVYKRASVGPKYGSKSISMQRHQLPINRNGVNLLTKFPFESPIGNRLQIGDLYDPSKPNETAFDRIGTSIVTNHNIYRELMSFIEVNRVVDIGARLHGTIPAEVQEAVEAIHNIFNSDRPGHFLKVNRKFLTHFVSTDTTVGQTETEDRS